jgi:hypothetical protein
MYETIGWLDESRATPEVACFQSEMIMIICPGVTPSTQHRQVDPLVPMISKSGVGISSVGIYIRPLAGNGAIVLSFSDSAEIMFE